MGGEDGVAPAIDEPEDIVLRDFLAETNATRAEDAALVIERDARTEFDVLRLLHLVFEKTRIRRPYSTLNSWSRHSPA